MAHSQFSRDQKRAITCVFIGDNSLVLHCAELAQQRGHHVRCLITSEPSIARWAQSRGMSTLPGDGDYGTGLIELLSGQALDVLFSVANLRRVPGTILRLARLGGVNFHDGPLPRYGGMHAPAWALMAGEREYAITWHRMTDRMDAGEIILQRAVDIAEDDTSLTLNMKCFMAAADSFGELLGLLAGSDLHTRVHELDRTTFHRRSDRVPAAATLDWTQSSRDLLAIVRALDFGDYRNTLGAAKAAFPQELVIVRHARAVAEPSGARPGTVVRVDQNGIVVTTGSGDVLLDSFTTLDGDAISSMEAAARGGVVRGHLLPQVAAEHRARLSAVDRESAPHEDFWVQRLRMEPVDVRALLSGHGGTTRRDANRPWQWLDPIPFPDSHDRGGQPQLAALARVCRWLGDITKRSSYDVALVVASTYGKVKDIERWVMDAVPLRVDLAGFSMTAVTERLAEAIGRLTKAGIPLRDLVARTPELRKHRQSCSVAVILGDSSDDAVRPSGSELAFAIDSRGNIRIGFDDRAFNADALQSVAGLRRA